MKKQAKAIILVLVILAIIILLASIQHQNVVNKKSNSGGLGIDNEASLINGNASSAINSTTINISQTQNLTNQTPEILEIDYECLNDTHCNDTEICINHTCKELNCPYPLYSPNHKCIGNKCANDTDCKSNQICYFSQKECIRLECSPNEYAENHVCKKYECSSNSDCNGAECFYHKCLWGADYLNFETLDTGNTRTNGKRILDYTLLKNWDIGLFIAQNQSELDNINNSILNIGNRTANFSEEIVLLIVQHGLIPTDARFNAILQKDNTIYLKLITSENETGVGDDAWHIITLKRDNFTEKNNLDFRITPTGKMVIGGEQMLSGITINYPADEKGNQYINPCVNETFYEGETKTINLFGKNYLIEVKSVERTGGIEYVYISVDGGAVKRIEEGNTTKIGDLSIYASNLIYSFRDYKPSDAELGICYEG